MVWKGLIRLNPNIILILGVTELVDIQGCLIKYISSTFDEGALRNVTPKNTNFDVSTDFSVPYTLAPSSFHISSKWNSKGYANGIILCA